jgi:hypothetical protein
VPGHGPLALGAVEGAVVLREPVVGRVVDVHQDQVEALQGGPQQVAVDIALDDLEPRLGREVLREGQQPARHPVDDEVHLLHHPHARDAGVLQRRLRGVAEPEPAHEHPQRSAAGVQGQGAGGEAALGDVVQAAHQELAGDADLVDPVDPGGAASASEVEGADRGVRVVEQVEVEHAAALARRPRRGCPKSAIAPRIRGSPSIARGRSSSSGSAATR